MNLYKLVMSVRSKTAKGVIMAITIEEALYPLLLTSSLLGFGAYLPKKIYLNIFYNLIVWIIYPCLFYYVIIEFKAEEWFYKPCHIISILVSYLIVIISIITNIYYNKRFWIFIKRLAAVDNTLEKLGTPKLYHKLHVYAKRLLIGWLVSTNIININDMVWWEELEKPYILIFIYIVNHHVHVNTFMGILFVTLLWYISIRFDEVNKHMRCLLIKQEYGLRCTWKNTILTHRHITRTNYYKHILWTLMHLHLELCRISRELNEIFGIQMTMQMITYMMSFITTWAVFYLYGQTKFLSKMSLSYWLDLQIWIFSYVIKIFCLNYACEHVSAKANEMERIIHQLTDFLRYADIRDEIYQFTLCMIYHPLKFTGLGCFYFGNGLLRKFIMTLITVIIFIIQMFPIPIYDNNFSKFIKEENISNISLTTTD